MRASVSILLGCALVLALFSLFCFFLRPANESNDAAKAIHGAALNEDADIDQAVIPTPTDRPNSSPYGRGFIIVHGTNADSVSAQINRRIDQGFVLEGTLFTERIGPAGFEYIQAMRSYGN
ncbi:hypothetical protein KLP40_14455 [Hymenobacter sp. NST-14]|uniref:hypothetical protein n=1 Tax=Hymenobacter piscis TaxID=2839984 RepID=UPI001C02EED9|nr:hypothetical protein [Hymenobacter piscis]MBT9394369.1 hypothetical protein [Hymenobacter piscis]